MYHLVAVGFAVTGFMSTKSCDPSNWKLVAAPALYMALMGLTEFVGFLIYWNTKMLIPSLLKACISVIQVGALSKLWAGLARNGIYNNVFFMNITVNNREEVLDKQVRNKTDVFPKAIASFAKKLVDNSKFAKIVSEKMINILPAQLANKGITAQVENVFSYDSYFVLEVRVTAVDLPKAMHGTRSK